MMGPFVIDGAAIIILMIGLALVLFKKRFEDTAVILPGLMMLYSSHWAWKILKKDKDKTY